MHLLCFYLQLQYSSTFGDMALWVGRANCKAARSSNCGVPIRSMLTLDRALTHPELDRVDERHMNEVDDKDVVTASMLDFLNKDRKKSGPGGEPVYASSDGSSTGCPPDTHAPNDTNFLSEAPSTSPPSKGSLVAF
jgi:hypothetical protein